MYITLKSIAVALSICFQNFDVTSFVTPMPTPSSILLLWSMSLISFCSIKVNHSDLVNLKIPKQIPYRYNENIYKEIKCSMYGNNFCQCFIWRPKKRKMTERWIPKGVGKGSQIL